MDSSRKTQTPRREITYSPVGIGGEFRKLLLSELESRCKRNPKYSLRSFAKFLGIEPSSLSQLFRGKRPFSSKMIQRLATRLGLSPDEINRLSYCNPTVSNDYREFETDQFHLIRDWYHMAILELFKLKGFKAQPRWMAQRLGLKTAEIAAALERLNRLGFIDRDPSGKWVLCDDEETTTTVGLVPSSGALRTMQAQVLEKAIVALEECPAELRDQSTMTIAVSRSRLQEAKERIKHFRRSLCEFLENGDEREDVYHLSISLYPVTKGENKNE